MEIEPYERAIIDAALRIVGPRAMPVAELESRLDAEGLLDELDEFGYDLGDVLALTDRFHTTDDDEFIARMDLRMDGVVLTHRVAQSELDDGVLVATPDLIEITDGLEIDEHLELATGGAVELEFDLENDDGDYAHGMLVGPVGWLSGCAAGELIALTRRGERVALARIDEAALTDGEREVAHLRARYDAMVGGHPAPVEPGWLINDALVLDPDAWMAPTAPVTELLERAGLELDGAFVGPEGASWRRSVDLVQLCVDIEEDYGLGDPCCRRALALAIEAYAGFDPDGGLGGVDVTELGAALTHSSVTEGLVAYAIGSDPSDRPDRLLEFAKALHGVHPSCEAAGALMTAYLCEVMDQGETAARLIGLAAQLDPDFDLAIDEYASVLADEGDLDGAIALRRDLDLSHDEELAYLLALRPTRRAEVGRNVPCPCGSGRKFKHCCLNKPVELSPLQRANWLLHKLLRYMAQRHFTGDVHEVIDATTRWQTDDDAIEQIVSEVAGGGLVVCWLLFDGGFAERFVTSRGARLPEAEREMLDDWLSRPLQLLELVSCERGVSLTMRDCRTGEHFEVHDVTASREGQIGEMVLAHLGRVGDELIFVGPPLAVAHRDRDRALELTDYEHIDALDIADWYAAACAPPVLVNREGHATVLCDIETAATASREEMIGILDSAFRSDGDDRWLDVIDLDAAERVIRATIDLTETGTLRVQTNSTQRADDLVARLAAAVPGLRVLRDDRESLDEARARLRSRPNGGTAGLRSPADAPPELQAALEEHLRTLELRWCDESIPALGGLTPRQALDDPTRREDLIALLREFDEYAQPGGFDAGRIRAHLGLR